MEAFGQYQGLILELNLVDDFSLKGQGACELCFYFLRLIN